MVRMIQHKAEMYHDMHDLAEKSVIIGNVLSCLVVRGLWKLFFFFYRALTRQKKREEFGSFAVSIKEIKRRATINCSSSCH